MHKVTADWQSAYRTNHARDFEVEQHQAGQGKLSIFGVVALQCMQQLVPTARRKVLAGASKLAKLLPELRCGMAGSATSLCSLVGLPRLLRCRISDQSPRPPANQTGAEPFAASFLVSELLVLA